jgi:hypothetical protein
MQKLAGPGGGVACLAIVVVMLAGCGSSNETPQAKLLKKQLSVPGVSKYEPPAKPVAASYSVTLSGFPRGAGSRRGSPNGSALALIDVNPTTNELCWTFKQVQNIPHPTKALLFRLGAIFPVRFVTSSVGIPLGHTYTPAGCIREDPRVLGLVTSKPQEFYVNIHDAEYPLGAVRGPLVG